MLLRPQYTTTQLARHDDFKDNQTTNGVAATHEWRYVPEGATHALMEYPLDLIADIQLNRCLVYGWTSRRYVGLHSFL